MSRESSWALSLALLGLLAACASVKPADRTQTIDTDVVVRDHPLTLHVSALPRHSPAPFILYATGDGGWGGSDEDLFDQLATWGYPAAGFSAHDYVKHLSEGADALSPEEMAADFGALIQAALNTLALPADTGVVLVGKSRGAGLDVAVAGQDPVRSQLRGIIAIALTREEEYVWVRPKDGRAPAMLLTYPWLPRLGAVPVAVIQSTHDDYIPAAEARALFGPDTSSRTLRPIESSDHNFGGGVAELYREMSDCFEWILRQ